MNALLPPQDFEESLYRGLVTEGILVEEGNHGRDSDREEIVFIAYERLADHIAAGRLLDAHLDAGDPAAAFAPGFPHAFLCDPEVMAPGLLEAIFIQIPERTAGREILLLRPARQRARARERAVAT